MKSMWQDATQREMAGRLARLAPERQAQWGVLMYRHTDHHFRQFGV
jgi:hypothetical protein